ncbi:MAG: lipopolysaccharide heptosyltransferase II [Elusimicrobiota bacterium]
MSTRLISFIGWLVVNLINRTLRVAEVNALDWWKRPDGTKVLFAFWHGEQLIPFFHHRKQAIAIMSSLSRDGEIQSGIIKLLGYTAVRGSSTKGAERALVGIIRLVKKGMNAAFAVDGPKGPYHKVKPGVIYIARKTGNYIVPLSSAASRYKVLEKAWDKYRVPAPFSRAVIAYGKPVKFDENTDIDKQCEALERELERLSAFTHKHYWSENIPEYLSNHPRPRILIVQPSRIGDVVFAMPAVAAIRKKYPHAWIGWAVDERCAPVLEGSDDINEIIVLDRAKYSPAYLWKLRRNLRSRNIDLSIDFHGLLKSAFVVWLAGAKFRIASSSTNGMREFSWLFSKEIKTKNEDSHCVERHMRVAEYLGCGTKEYKYGINIDEATRRNVLKILEDKGIDSGKILVAMHAGGGWISRRWPAERFAELAGRLSKELNASVALVGGREGGSKEKGVNETILSLSGGGITDLTGKLTLKELGAFLRRTNLYVGNEAGPMHLAVALETPVIALIGPTIPGRTGPFGGGAKIIRQVVDCQPCRNRNCKNRKCMEAITVDKVFNSAKEMLRIK